MSVYAFVKQAKTGELPEGEYPFSVVALSAETQDELDAKKAEYLGNGYEDATKEDYEAETGATVNEDGSITPAPEDDTAEDEEKEEDESGVEKSAEGEAEEAGEIAAAEEATQ